MPRVKIKVRRSKNFLKRPEFYFCLVILCFAGTAFWFVYGPSTNSVSDDSVNIQVDAPPVVFPDDEGPHEVMTEWWYYNGHLKASTGERFSYHYTIFAHKTLTTHSIVHASLLDHQTMKTHHYQTRIPGFQTIQKPSGQFVLGHLPWQMSLLQGQDNLVGHSDEFQFDLDLESPNVVLQEADAILDFKDAGESYYYSRPRMQTQGSLIVEGQTYEVEGSSWFDHQWGEFRASVLNWDWFALQLDNGMDIMLFSLRDFDNNEVHIAGTLFHKGKTYYLSKDDFKVEPGRVWTSKLSGHDYPVEWAITIPRFNVDLFLQAFKDESEFNAVETTYGVYWEGPVRITENKNNHLMSVGQGFVEISKANSKHTKSK